MSDLTGIIRAAADGDTDAANELITRVYEPLKRLAASKMANEPAGHTLQPTALVHETYLRLFEAKDIHWTGRTQFFAAAAEAMRRILIDRARRKLAAKRGEGIRPISFDKIDVAIDTSDTALLLVNEALEKLECHDTQCAQLVKLRFFVGMTSDEAARSLGISERTARRTWAYARSWLYDEMESNK